MTHGYADAIRPRNPSTPTRARALYAKIGLILFVLTALEVGLYEITYGEHAGALGAIARSRSSCPLLLLMSAIKFALVAMFYMHLKQDQPALRRRVRLPAHHRDGDHPRADRAQAYHFAFADSG